MVLDIGSVDEIGPVDELRLGEGSEVVAAGDRDAAGAVAFAALCRLQCDHVLPVHTLGPKGLDVAAGRQYAVLAFGPVKTVLAGGAEDAAGLPRDADADHLEGGCVIVGFVHDGWAVGRARDDVVLCTSTVFDGAYNRTLPVQTVIAFGHAQDGILKRLVGGVVQAPAFTEPQYRTVQRDVRALPGFFGGQHRFGEDVGLVPLAGQPLVVLDPEVVEEQLASGQVRLFHEVQLSS